MKLFRFCLNLNLRVFDDLGIEGGHVLFVLLISEKSVKKKPKPKPNPRSTGDTKQTHGRHGRREMETEDGEHEFHGRGAGRRPSERSDDRLDEQPLEPAVLGHERGV